MHQPHDRTGVLKKGRGQTWGQSFGHDQTATTGAGFMSCGVPDQGKADKAAHHENPPHSPISWISILKICRD
ncbi:Hypothetical protein GbCGDNIH2_7001 [Granulibacter bethesdensis]|uniref:Uncharacterized protein n=1 Tax=Granulibacter bethesdensis (strain ATCC BAA-1260 / CGDNIH1) TaxID=391165 RepID=A0A286M2T4_GRABC|nr:Hypothetical protein GbCGDNIH2_7001 [Granulibacter bethesdensis]APH50687.1 Hypothetical protein GbCGDNIH5_7001 [Granulibacter bethesdensis]APH58306.1 Hypothetical protein GbCGDNIH7_7001 [Granulibacter bethesdensis]APH63382.1 Hypothetical protein GbCGDNIH1I4_7001 [Granulibacter bethesdensis]ASV62333.1 Hypothetical protein GbCGDNIH1_7001 [Granulibacter bethesdensis CGDNIH1]